MKKFWKFLGITALAAALVPYRVETDENTGERKFEALLWKGTSARRNGERQFDISVGPHFSAQQTECAGDFEDDWDDCIFETEDWDEDDGFCESAEPSASEAPAEPEE